MVKEIKVLSSIDYEESNKNYGDCIIIDNTYKLIVFDCGSEEHAKKVIEYMKQKGYEEVSIILSHNDSDHFNGINYLLDNVKVNEIYTLLLLKYKDELLDKINDKRKTRDSIARDIEEIYANIYSLSEKTNLKDIFTDKQVALNVKIIGPSKDEALDAIAKRIDGREGDTIDKETIVNAVSTQVSIEYKGRNILLTGDSSFEYLSENLKSHDIIQLPHHGKSEQAEKIFEEKAEQNETVYLVSDNTGGTNGGSSKTNFRGHKVFNTLVGTIALSKVSLSSAIGCLGGIENDLYDSFRK